MDSTVGGYKTHRMSMRVPIHTHTHIHTHLYTRTYIHMETTSDAYVHICTQIHIHAQLYTYTYIRVEMHVIYTYIPTNRNTSLCTYTYIQVENTSGGYDTHRMCIFVNKPTYIHIHTYIPNTVKVATRPTNMRICIYANLYTYECIHTEHTRGNNQGDPETCVYVYVPIYTRINAYIQNIKIQGSGDP